MYKESLKKYMDDLASRKPAPGGGSAAAEVAATGVSLISMVANFTVGKEKYRAFEEEIKKILSSSEEIRDKLLNLVDEDVASYNKLAQAYKLPKDNSDDKERRDQAIQQGLKEALTAPFEVCKCCQQALKLCPIIAEKGNVNLISDVGVAAILLEAAFQSALVNVEINLSALKDEKFILEIKEALDPLEEKVVIIEEEVCRVVKNKMAANT